MIIRVRRKVSEGIEGLGGKLRFTQNARTRPTDDVGVSVLAPLIHIALSQYGVQIIMANNEASVVTASWYSNTNDCRRF